MEITVNRAQAAAITRKLDTMLAPTVQKLLERAAKFAREAWEADAPKDTGAIARSPIARVSGMSATVSSNMAGALPLNYGRHSRKGPPVGALLAWMSRHGIDPSLQYPIARAIAQRGTKGRFFVQRAVQRLHNLEMPRLLEQSAHELVDVWRGR